MGRDYEEPTLVLFAGAVESACGTASAAVGPFYCPGDEQVYLDLDFFRELERSLGAPGDLAQTYVVAHEVGHHVQKLLGTSDQVTRARERASEEEANELSVRLELQADFFAGVFVHHAQERWRILEEGDVEEAMNAAGRIGDDWLQKQSQGYAVPESFTHGTSEQRTRWFTRGLESGDPEDGDTFAARDL
jgi:predicted metalloprotease